MRQEPRILKGNVLQSSRDSHRNRAPAKPYLDQRIPGSAEKRESSFNPLAALGQAVVLVYIFRVGAAPLFDGVASINKSSVSVNVQDPLMAIMRWKSCLPVLAVSLSLAIGLASSMRTSSEARSQFSSSKQAPPSLQSPEAAGHRYVESLEAQ